MNNPESNPLPKTVQTNNSDLSQHLLNLRQAPDPALRQRVRAIPRRSKKESYLWPRLAWGLAALTLVALLFTSPPAQAMLGEMEQVIGRIHLLVMESLPTHTGPVVVESTPMSLENAQHTVPFNFAIPTHLPAGLVADQEVFVTEIDQPIVKVRWPDTGDGFVQLSARPHSTETNLTQTRIGPESSHTLLIKGQPAVIIYGGWDESSRIWRHQDRVMALIWEIEGVQYELLSFSRMVSLTDLVAMAESVQ